MAMEDMKIPYELLVRFNPDGKPKGAHVEFLRRLVVDGEVLKEERLPARPVDIEDFPTSDLMQALNKDALAEVTRMNDLVDWYEGQLRQAVDDRNAAEESAKVAKQNAATAYAAMEAMKISMLSPNGGDAA